MGVVYSSSAVGSACSVGAVDGVSPWRIAHVVTRLVPPAYRCRTVLEISVMNDSQFCVGGAVPMGHTEREVGSSARHKDKRRHVVRNEFESRRRNCRHKEMFCCTNDEGGDGR